MNIEQLKKIKRNQGKDWQIKHQKKKEHHVLEIILEVIVGVLIAGVVIFCDKVVNHIDQEMEKNEIL